MMSEKLVLLDHVLLKPGKLTDEEFELIRKHTVFGSDIPKNIKYVDSDVVSGVLEHHERLDGSGYPYGKKDGEISLFGQIIGISDVFDALSAKRVYEEALDPRWVLDVLEENAKAGKYDEQLISILKALVQKYG